MSEIKVLDHGLVRLVDSMGGDLSVSRAARVSYDSPPRPEDAKLINYLMKHKHTSPFESVTATFEIKAPIFVLRQWHRHRTQSYNELSARYRPLPEEFYVPEVTQITTQSKDNKQMRTDEVNEYAEDIQQLIEQASKTSHIVYNKLIHLGCPRELARSVLPVNTYSHMFTTANLLNWFRFLSERLHPHAQYEIRVYAEAILQLLEPVAPLAVAAFKEHWLNHG